MTAPNAASGDRLAPWWVLVTAAVLAFLLGAFAPWDSLPWDRKCEAASHAICVGGSQQAGR